MEINFVISAWTVFFSTFKNLYFKARNNPLLFFLRTDLPSCLLKGEHCTLP